MSDQTDEESDEREDAAAGVEDVRKSARSQEGEVSAASAAAWEATIGDMESTASAYGEAGWEVHQCHPGEVTAVTGEATDATPHLDVLLPDDEYEAVESLLESGATFTEYEVLKAEEGGVVYFVVVMEDPDSEVALLYPGYYDGEAADPLFEHAGEAGALHTRLRRLDGEYVELVHEDPELFEAEE